MKKITVAITLCLLSTISFAQKLNIQTYKDIFKIIRQSPIKVQTGVDKEFDEAVKFALEKYWKFSAIQYVGKDDESANFWYKDAKSRHGKNDFEWSYCSFSFPDAKVHLSYDFDYYKAPGFKAGVDENFHAKSVKVIAFIMNFSAEMARIEEWGISKYSFHYGFKDKVKDYNIIVPKENITTNRFTESSFTGSFNKVTFLTVDEINKLIREQKNTDNTGLLFFSISGAEIRSTIIDLKTGDLLYTQREVPRGEGYNVKKPLDDKDMKSLLKPMRKRKD
ncbi:MAG: hypothetical protein K0S33_4094 [Bacteroidetes bacterium]|nr:hypothetical protein [Bacteroidota bacterium]